MLFLWLYRFIERFEMAVIFRIKSIIENICTSAYLSSKYHEQAFIKSFDKTKLKKTFSTYFSSFQALRSDEKIKNNKMQGEWWHNELKFACSWLQSSHENYEACNIINWKSGVLAWKTPFWAHFSLTIGAKMYCFL